MCRVRRIWVRRRTQGGRVMEWWLVGLAFGLWVVMLLLVWRKEQRRLGRDEGEDREP